MLFINPIPSPSFLDNSTASSRGAYAPSTTLKVPSVTAPSAPSLAPPHSPDNQSTKR